MKRAVFVLLGLCLLVLVLRASSPHTYVGTNYGRITASTVPCMADDTCPPVYGSFGEQQSHQ